MGRRFLNIIDTIRIITSVSGIVLTLVGIYFSKYFLVFFLFLPLLLLINKNANTNVFQPVSIGTNKKQRTLFFSLLIICYFLMLQLLFIFIFNPKLISNFVIKFSYFFFTSFALFLTILFLDNSNNNNSNYAEYLTLFSIIFWGILIRIIIYFEYPLYIGIDTWWHALMYKGIVRTGYVQSYVLYYSKFPMFHVYSAIVSIISSFYNNLFYDKLLFIMIIIVPETIISVIITYLMIRKLFINAKVSLIAGLIISINMIHVLWSYWIIAMSLAIIYSIIFIFICFKILKTNSYDFTLLTISIVIAIAIIPTHPLYTLIVILFVILLVTTLTTSAFVQSSFLRSFRRLRNEFLKKLTTLLLVITWSYWSITEYILKTHIINSLRFLFKFEILIVKSISSPISDFFKYSSITIFIVLAFYGILILLNHLKDSVLSKNNIHTKLPLSLLFCLVGLALLVFAGISLMLNLTAFFPDRWPPFIAELLIIPVSVSVYSLLKTKNRYSSILLIVILVMLLLTNFLYPGFYPEGSIQDIDPNNYEHGQNMGAIYSILFFRTYNPEAIFGSDLLLDPVFGYYQLNHVIVSYYWINNRTPPVDIMLLRQDILSGERFYHADHNFRGIISLHKTFRYSMFNSYIFNIIYSNNYIIGLYKIRQCEGNLTLKIKK